MGRRKPLTTGIAVFLATLLNLGCSSIGPGKLVSTHEGYNDAVQMAVSREVLKNIVRLRYYDPIQFMRVTAVNANFSVSADNSAGVTVVGIGNANTSEQVGANIGYSDSPTITFVPQSDANFNKSLDSPVELP